MIRKFNKIGLIIAGFFLAGPLFSQDIWTQRDSVNGPPKGACVAFAVGGDGYIGLGHDYDNFKRTMYSYNPVQDDWDDEESLGGPSGGGLNRGSAVSFVVNDKAYVGLGQGADPFFKDFWEYDPVTKVWTQKADFGGTERRQAVAFAIDSAGYVGTGQDINGYTRDFWKYMPATNTWTQIADFGGSARKQAVAFTMKGFGYVGTGDNGTFTKDFWMYDPALNNWTQKADFGGTARYAATGFALDAQAFIMTGYDINLEFKKDVWEYNFYSDSWVQRGDFPGAARSNGAAFVLNGIAYFGTGYNGDYFDDFYEYTQVVAVDPEKEVQVSIYPNPVSERMNIVVGSSTISDLNIFDISGKNVSANFIPEAGYIGENKAVLSLMNAPRGTYLLSLKDNEDRVHVKKFLVVQ